MYPCSELVVGGLVHAVSCKTSLTVRAEGVSEGLEADEWYPPCMLFANANQGLPADSIPTGCGSSSNGEVLENGVTLKKKALML